MDTIQNEQRAWIIGGIVIAIIIILLGWLIMRQHSYPTGMNSNGTATTSGATTTTTGASTTTTVPKAPSQVTTSTATSDGESVAVADQAAGNTVALSSVHLTKRSWVAIEDSRKWTLGAKRLEASDTEGTVPLLRNTTAGETYTAVIYADNGDGVFDIHADTMLLGSDGNPVSATFIAR